MTQIIERMCYNAYKEDWKKTHTEGTYASFNEFLDNEFMDEEYMKELISKTSAPQNLQKVIENPEYFIFMEALANNLVGELKARDTGDFPADEEDFYNTLAFYGDTTPEKARELWN